MVTSLYNLPCFTNIIAIERITAGMSSQCYKVITEDQAFFAKVLHCDNKSSKNETAKSAAAENKAPNNEVPNNETSMARLAARGGISPPVIYSDQHWLVTPFIDGIDLSLLTKPLVEKIDIATALLAQCHRLSAKRSGLIPLSPSDIIAGLMAQTQLALIPQQPLQTISAQLTQRLTQQLTQPLATQTNNAQNQRCCHGDLNFSNVLIDNQQASWLLDFECAYLAPAEFDLAMLIAVNNIELTQREAIIAAYRKHNVSTNINRNLLTDYLLFSYFINGLWYLQKYQQQTAIADNTSNASNTDTEIFNILAQQQWRQFDALAVVHLPRQQQLLAIL